MMVKKSVTFSLLLILFFFLQSCAVPVKPGAISHDQTVLDIYQNASQTQDREQAATEALVGVKPASFRFSPLEQSKCRLKHRVVAGRELKHVDFDLPIKINSRVEYWVDYFSNRGQKYFARYLIRSDYFAPYIEHLLQEQGLPKDFVFLAMIESGFNNFARSKAKAVGPWQFITGTAKHYGLTINWWLDERRDIRKSTLAAARYLKELYNLFESWELAAAAYNAGEAKVARAIRRYETKDFWALARHKFLKPETRDYVPKIIAAAIIGKNREVFGFTPAQMLLVQPSLSPQEALKNAAEEVNLKQLGEVPDAPNESTAEELAENILDGIENSSDAMLASTGGGSLLDNIAALGDIPSLKSESALGAMLPSVLPPIPHVLKSGEAGHENIFEYELPGPSDLFRIAQAAGITYELLKGLNPELLRWCTPPNIKNFRIKLPISAKQQFFTSLEKKTFIPGVQFYTYRAKKGDTPMRISRLFGIRLDPVLDLNRLKSDYKLLPGASVYLPLPVNNVRSMASLEVLDAPEKSSLRKAKPRRGRAARMFSVK